ncbi:sensor histidine kinase [Leptolyngbya sp. AN03gr2]|uniref:sensor histidine kinase n=1 Tax=unclassified Leptolyngbya TaxID=2650499 RepID=UPI003D315954
MLQTRSFDPDTTARALATIERNATIEAKLIKDLLDVSNILSGKLRLKPQLVDLASLVRSVTTTFREAAQAKHIQLVETISDELQRDIFADGDRLRQVITNLLDNAIKFTPQGGQVNIQLERLDNEIQITVSDTGIGIHPDFLPYLSDRFTQAEIPSRHTPGGVGIGLAIAHHLIELHHGTIEVASVGGSGATFTIRLPIQNTVEFNANTSTQKA